MAVSTYTFSPPTIETRRTYSISSGPLLIVVTFKANDKEVETLIFETYAAKVLGVMAYHLQYPVSSLQLCAGKLFGVVNNTRERIAFDFEREKGTFPKFDNAFAKRVADHLLTHEKCELLREFHFTVTLKGPESSGKYEHCPAHPRHAVIAK